jgi:hypothetical protein
MDPGKLSGIKIGQPPTRSKKLEEIPRFWKLLSTIHRGFADLAKPLNDLLKKDQNSMDRRTVNELSTLSRNDSLKNRY